MGAVVLNMNRSWKTILAATGFNLLFEYSMRGVNNLLVQPVLPLVLFTVYFTLYAMLNDLIARFRLRDFHLLVAAFFFGTLYQFLVSGSAILLSSVLGVNWTSLLFVVVVWWGLLQSVLTFYIANRVAPRDWNHRLSRIGWAVMLLLNGSMVLLFQRSGVIPRATATQLIIMAVIVCASALMFHRTLQRGGQRSFPLQFSRSVPLDFLCIMTVVIFAFCAVFLMFDPIKAKTSNVNATSTVIVVGWTMLLSSIALVYRLYSRKPISV